MGSPDLPCVSSTPPKLQENNNDNQVSDQNVVLNGVSDEVVNLEISPPEPNPMEHEQEQDTSYICVRIIDLEGGFAPQKNTVLNCTPKTTVGDFVNEVVGITNLSLDDFEIIYQVKSDIFKLTTLPHDQKLTTIHLLPSREKTYSMSLQKKVKRRAVRNLVKEFASNGCEDTGANSLTFSNGHSKFDENGHEAFDLPTEVIPEQSLDLSSIAGHDYQDEYDLDEKEPIGKDTVGLQNQQFTCYLNSLIQGLYAYPEFRNMVYSQKIEHSNSHKSIILAIRKLFLQLQFSKRHSVGTKDLTRTFGWRGREHQTQHDLDEMFRLLIESLDPECPSRSIFGGVFANYVRCLNCGQENINFEYGQLQTLCIADCENPPDYNLNSPTLDAALELFVRPETIEYTCERETCRFKTNAQKGCRPQKLPYFLNLHLARYTPAQQKLTNEIQFPFILDMNSLVDKKTEWPEPAYKLVPPMTAEGVGLNYMKPFQQRTSHSRPYSGWKSKGITYPVADPYAQEIETLLKNGPDVYRLLAVLVHKGNTLSSGHYMAFTYDLERHQWYSCNDSVTYETDEDAVRNCFGSNFKRTRDYGEAYILMYRRIDNEFNSLPMTIDELPEETRKLWEELEEEDLREFNNENFEKKVVRERVAVRFPESIYNLTTYDDVIIWKSSTFREAAYQVAKDTCGIDFTKGRVRFVKYHKLQNFCIESYEKKENLHFGVVHNEIMKDFNDKYHEFLLEINDPDEGFQIYCKDDLVFKAHHVDHKKNIIVSTKEIHFKKEDQVYTVESLFELMTVLFNVPLEDLSIAIFIENEPRLLTELSVRLNELPLGRASEILIENIDSKDACNFITFANQFYNSYIFGLEFENLPPAPNLNDTFEIESQTELSPDETLDLESKCSQSKPDVDVENLFALEMDGSEQKKDIDECDLERANDNNSGSSDDSCPSDTSEPTFPQRSGRFLVCSPTHPEEYFFTVLHDFPWIYSPHKKYYIRAFHGTPLSYLSKKIEQLFGVDEANTLIYSVYNSPRNYAEAELTVIDDTPLRELERFTEFHLKLGQRLGPGEMRMPVYLLNFDRYMEEQVPICEVILHGSLNGIQAREACFYQLSQLIDMDPSSQVEFRLRRRRNGNPSKVIRKTSCLLSEMFTSGFGELIIQPLHGPECLTHMSYPIILRHFNPSALTLGPPFEVILHPSLDPADKVLQKLISETTGIPLDQVEYSICEGQYPFTVHPLHLIEKVQWSNFRGGMQKLLLTHTEECALYVRDGSQEPGEITEPMRRNYERETNPSYYSPIKNQKLGIDLSRTP